MLVLSQETLSLSNWTGLTQRRIPSCCSRRSRPLQCIRLGYKQSGGGDSNSINKQSKRTKTMTLKKRRRMVSTSWSHVRLSRHGFTGKQHNIHAHSHKAFTHMCSKLTTAMGTYVGNVYDQTTLKQFDLLVLDCYMAQRHEQEQPHNNPLLMH